MDMNIVTFQDSGFWIAQGIEYDFAAQGKTEDTAIDSIERLFLGQIYLDESLGIPPLSDTPPMPKGLI